MGMFGHNGWLGGRHSLGGKFSSGFGDFLNDITGQSSSAKQQYKQQIALQHDAQDFSKWQMANAHQMEVQDLQNAGLNPILSANAGASAGVTEGGTTGGTPSADPIAMAGAIISMMNSTKQTNAEVDKAKAEIRNNTKTTDINAENSKKLTKAQIANLNANTGRTNYDTDLDKEKGVNGNTPYPIRMLKEAKTSAKREMKEWKEKSKQDGWKGFKYKARNWLFRQ